MTENPTFVGFLFVSIGVIIMLGAAMNWAIVTRPGKLFNRIFGDSIARVIYFVAGIFLFVAGVGRLIGANWF